MTKEQNPDGSWVTLERPFRAYPNAIDETGIIDMLAQIGKWYATDQSYGSKAERVFDEIFN